MFELELASGRKVRAHLAGGMKVKYTRLLPGENVQVEVSPFDEGRGKIVDRLG
jgi:translation initiation factor IF-1